ncbi:MAG: hypothetical protein ACJA1A_002000 [Saprospiraceae bacterium]|jgi:hypothetical protein|tara:strand:- start:36 stop:254 length:219 start_codon:yes stop_codon:yes gene_type:complete
MNKFILILAVLVTTHIYSQTPITNANFQDAIDICLETNPVDGMSINSEYGHNMSEAFQNQPSLNYWLTIIFL